MHSDQRKCIRSTHIKPRFVSVSQTYIPTSTGEAENIFITRSYDATSHFETVVDEVRDVWKRVTGKELKLKKKGESENSAGGDTNT